MNVTYTQSIHKRPRVKFEKGQLAMVTRPNCNSTACIVLERASVRPVWYKVYMIEKQCISHFMELTLSPINPQASESEV